MHINISTCLFLKIIWNKFALSDFECFKIIYSLSISKKSFIMKRTESLPKSLVIKINEPLKWNESSNMLVHPFEERWRSLIQKFHKCQTMFIKSVNSSIAVSIKSN